MYDALRALALLGAVAAVSACGNDGDGGGVSCDGSSDAFCPCDIQVNEGRRYLFCQDAVTWEEARELCRSFGSELAKIESESEQAFVWGVAGAIDGDYWIGLTDAEEEGVFVWSDGTPLGSFAPWAFEQPDNGDGEIEEDCIELIQIENGLWNDRDCDTDYLDYICEGPV